MVSVTVGPATGMVVVVREVLSGSVTVHGSGVTVEVETAPGCVETIVVVTSVIWSKEEQNWFALSAIRTSSHSAT